MHKEKQFFTELINFNKIVAFATILKGELLFKIIF